VPKCDLDDCSLKDDIGDIKDNQVKATEAQQARDVNQARFEQKIDDYIKQDIKDKKENKEENEKVHERLFARTRRVVKFEYLVTIILATGVIIGIVIKLT